MLVINILNSLNRLSAPKENSTNLEFSMCDTRLPQKKSYDVVNGLALLLTADDLGRSKGWYWDGNSCPWSWFNSGNFLLICMVFCTNRGYSLSSLSRTLVDSNHWWFEIDLKSPLLIWFDIFFSRWQDHEWQCDIPSHYFCHHQWPIRASYQ